MPKSMKPSRSYPFTGGDKGILHTTRSTADGQGKALPMSATERKAIADSKVNYRPNANGKVRDSSPS